MSEAARRAARTPGLLAALTAAWRLPAASTAVLTTALLFATGADPARGAPSSVDAIAFEAAATAPPLLRAPTRELVDWVVRSGDHQGLGFIVVDKPGAALHIFEADGRLRGSTPVLLGAAVGDDSVPGIGERTLDDVRPHERTTPAGRFVAERGRNAKGVDVIWVDYDSGLSMHRVIDTVPEERRLQRMASPTIDDNRISYGCINVPVAFYESAIRPMFDRYRAIVYILPEQRSLRQVFGIGGSRVASDGEAAAR